MFSLIEYIYCSKSTFSRAVWAAVHTHSISVCLWFKDIKGIAQELSRSTSLGREQDKSWRHELYRTSACTRPRVIDGPPALYFFNACVIYAGPSKSWTSIGTPSYPEQYGTRCITSISFYCFYLSCACDPLDYQLYLPFWARDNFHPKKLCLLTNSGLLP